MKIRAAEDDDHAGIDALLKDAFPGPDEAQLVVSLRAADADSLELVAEDKGCVIGMALFSPVTAQTDENITHYGLGLAPVAVLPSKQKRGIGAALIKAGLDYITTLGAPFCVVLGDHDYYARFDFKPASSLTWSWEKDEAGQLGDAFQCRVLHADKIPSGPVMVRYHAAFDMV